MKIANKLLITSIIGLYTLGSLSNFAQTTISRCGTENAHQHDADFLQHQENEQRNFENFLQNESNQRTSAVTIEIPIVVHLLTYAQNPESNISDAKIKSQIDILNADLGKTNSNLSSIVTEFKNLATDTKIRFKLATFDPQGKATTGIIRKASTKKMFAYEKHEEKYSSMGGDDPWDQKNYLNVWIVNDISYGGQSSGLLGRAQFPDDATPRNDGLTVRYYGWGSVAPVQQPYHLGRTATHEIGHWLGLKHIWGLTETDATCTDDDGITDTHKQQTQSSGCNKTKRTCGVLNMVQNYMDYSDDACLALFTPGQAAKMMYTMQTFRKEMLPIVASSREMEMINKISVFPNPTSNHKISIS